MMKLYNMLFYYSYLAGMRSHNFEGMPVTAGLISVLPNLILHVITLAFLLEMLGIPAVDYLLYSKVYLVIFFSLLYVLLEVYYSYKGRYKKIISYYEEKESNFWKRHPVWVYIISMLISIILLLVVGVLYHKIV